MKKSIIVITSIVTTSLLSICTVQANESLPMPVGQEMVCDVDLFTEEQMAEWNLEEPKNVEVDPKDYVRSPIGVWSTRPGVICINDARSSGVITHGHAGIIGIGRSANKIIESNLLDGVQAKRSRWQDANQVWQLTVKSTTVAQDEKAASWADAQIGKPYNINFYDVWRRDSFYCSQLVWAAYRDTVGPSADISLNDYGPAIHPFELRDHSNTKIIYRKK